MIGLAAFARAQQIDEAQIGVNLPPIEDCLNLNCRCYFRPHDIVA